MSEKRTYAVFLRTRRNQRSVLVREQYNVVQYGTDPNGMTFIEGLRNDALRSRTAAAVADAGAEIYDDIRVYDAPPFNSRFGGAV